MVFVPRCRPGLFTAVVQAHKRSITCKYSAAEIRLLSLLSCVTVLILTFERHIPIKLRR